MRRRDLFALPALVACGNTMNLDNGVQSRKPPQAPSVYDIRSLSSAGLLYAGFDAEYGATIASTLIAFSASHPAVTLTGNLRQWPALGLRIKCIDANTFDWSVENGWGWANGIGVQGVTIPKGGSLDLGIGIVAHFEAEDAPSGKVYGSTCNYQAAQAGLESFGYHPGCDLDNTSVFASRGLLVERWGCNNQAPALVRRNVTGLSPQALGNKAQLAGLVAGNNQAFEIWDLIQNNSSNTSTLAACDWCFSDSTNNTYNYLDAVKFGPDVEPGAQQRYVFNRRSQGAAIVVATAPMALDNSWHPRRIKFTGGPSGVLQVSMHGKDLFETPVPWTSGVLTPDQFLLFSFKLGNLAASNLPFAGFNKWLGYSGNLSDNQANELWRALS